MHNKLVAILMLDNISRKYIKTNITELGLMGIVIVNNFSEITDDMLHACNDIVILESYFQNAGAYSDLRLFKVLLKKNFIFIGVDTDLLDTLNVYGRTYKADPTMLDFDMIQAAIFQDSAFIDEATDKHSYNDNLSFAKNVLANEDIFDQRVQNLAKEFMSVTNELEHNAQELKKTRQNRDNYQSICAKLQAENESLTAGFAEMLKNAVNLNKCLDEYERILSKDIYEKISVQSYPNKPMIIYLKEYEELLHQNSFLETLFEVLRFQGKQSVKLLRLYDGASCRKVKTLPDYYHRIRNQFLVSDITTHDFIVKVGDYTDVLDILLSNKTGLDILILVDCKAMDDVVLGGAPMYLNLCRNRKNLSAYGLSAENSIVSGEESDGYMVWSHYEKYNELIGKDTRFLYLASRPVITIVYDLYKLLSTSI